jgi:hypothetical protein
MAAGRGSRRALRPLLVAASASAVTSAPSCGYLMGQAATFDLSPTTRKGEPSYRIVDGDIPCTPKIEENHTYVYNVCDDVTPESVPPECWRHGAAGAYRIDASGKCEAIGTWAGGSRVYDAAAGSSPPAPLPRAIPTTAMVGDSDSLQWQPLDGLDPSKGVEIVMSKKNKGGAYQGPCNGRCVRTAQSGVSRVPCSFYRSTLQI